MVLKLIGVNSFAPFAPILSNMPVNMGIGVLYEKCPGQLFLCHNFSQIFEVSNFFQDPTLSHRVLHKVMSLASERTQITYKTYFFLQARLDGWRAELARLVQDNIHLFP